MNSQKATLDAIIALCKRRGFIYQSAEIYGGLNGVYDIGHLGTLLKQNIRNLWKETITNHAYDILFMEGSLLGPHAVWQASGHIKHFHDPMVDCMSCKHRFRTDDINLDGACPHCGKKNWTEIRQFNMMFKTQTGAAYDSSAVAYLRPETAQSIFINFKNMISTNRVKIPFGIAQIGKAFRNEITPKQFLFRMREFEQMEIEWFCKEEDVSRFFEFWLNQRRIFYETIGINTKYIRLRDHNKNELAHYSTRTTDIEYQFPFGWKELEGIAHRGTFDLTQHTQHSGKELHVYDEQTKTSYIPHVIECSVGVDRLFLTLLFDAYTEDKIGGELRTVLTFHPKIAPIKAAFFPLTKKLTETTHKIYTHIKQKTGLNIAFDDAGSIGKRYRRHDEIGTPACFTYDFTSEQDQCVTVRDRDTTEQKRIAIDAIEIYISKLLNT